MPSRSNAPRRDLSAVPLWIARILVLLLLLASPWPYGMANWSAQLWLVPLVGVVVLLSAAVAWQRKVSVGNPVIWSMALVLAVGLLQIVTLPEALWTKLSPGAGFVQQVQQLAADFWPIQGTAAASPQLDGVVRSPRTLSVYPLQTRATTCVLALGLGMLLSASILFRDKLGLALLLGTLTLSGLLIALLGIYQAVAAGDWTLLDVRKESSFGTFYSRNSAPQFLACAIGAASGLLVLHRSQKNSRQRDSRYQLRYPSVNVVARFRRRLDELVADLDQLSFLGLLALVTLASGVLIANSRGGILACAVSGAVVILIYALGKQASASSTLGLLLLVACSGLFITFFELDDLIGQRLNTISEEVYRRDNSRLELWRMVLTQPSCWLLGSGLGTFHFAVLPAYDKPQSAWFYHAESVYVELLSNAGLLVLLAVLGGLSWLLWQLLGRTPRSTLARAARLACMFSVLAVALQSFVDFSLILPAVFLPLAALTGAFLGAPAGKQSSSRSSQGSSQRSSGGESRRVSSRAVPRGRVETQASPSSLESRFKMTAVASETPAWKAERLKLAAAAEKSANAPPAETAQETSTSKAFAAATDPRSRVREPDRESSTAAPANQSTLQLHGTLLGCLLLIAVAITLGSPPLRGFAYAEQLSTALNASGGQLGELGGGSRLDGLLNTIEHSPSLAAFPEIRLQLGRYRQEYAALALQSSNTWPQDITPEMRVALSRPEFFSTVFHASDDDAEFQRLREFIQPHQEVVAELRASQDDMRATLAACPLNWRASWGLMRADLGELDRGQRVVNYARILLTSRNNPQVLQAAATHALMTGETPVGLTIWRELLPVNDSARERILSLLDRFLSIEQLVEILPESRLLRIDIAKRLERNGMTGHVPTVLQAVDLKQAIGEAERSADWLDVAWAAEQLEDIDLQIDALKKASLGDPLNHYLNYVLAQRLQQAGRIDEAIEETNRARRQQPENESYKKLLEELESEHQP